MVKPTYDKSKPYCNGDHCTDQGHNYRESAFAKADIATVGFAIGGAGLLAGAILWLTAPQKAVTVGGLSIIPSAGQASSGLVVRGGW
jgi:hypothetical protein